MAFGSVWAHEAPTDGGPYISSPDAIPGKCPMFKFALAQGIRQRFTPAA